MNHFGKKLDRSISKKLKKGTDPTGSEFAITVKKL